ncbi:MAG: DUF1800 domain-containing protein [Oligoflexia bacterium]|nr:DUF1800 domain-containing protein [Oligoflexia bacterium]
MMVKLDKICLGLIPFLLSPALGLCASGEVNISNINDLTQDVEFEVQLSSGQTVTKNIDCYGSTPGTYKKSKGKSILVKLSGDVTKAESQVKKYKAEVKKFSKQKSPAGKKSLKKAKNKLGQAKTKLADAKIVQDQANEACSTPDYLALSKYKGNFGIEQARILCNRFRFGCSLDELQHAASQGLDAFVDEMTQPVSEGGLDNDFNSMKCDGKLPNDPQHQPCDPVDFNDVYSPGVRYGLYRYALLSPRPYFWRMWMFYSDEFMAASTNNSSWCTRYAIIDHFNMLRNMALSGDFRSFMHAWSSDIMGNLENLDGGVNIALQPNENFAREQLELGTVGVIDANGNPVYGDFDIAQSALANTGWQLEYKELDYGGTTVYACLRGYFDALHAQGPKYLFSGTPYQAVVYNHSDVVNAVMNHPAVAENIARKLFRVFVNPYATPKVLKQLATKIRSANFNLNEVVRSLMKSKAMFAAGSQNSLMRDSYELLIGFFKSTGIPLADENYPAKWNYEWMDWRLDDLGMRPLLPKTIFGFYPEAQAGAAEVADRRNVFNGLLLQSTQSLATKGFHFEDLLAGMTPSGTGDAYDTVNRIAQIMGLQLNEAQKQEYVQYMIHNAQQCSNWAVQQGKCANTSQPYYLELVGFVANPNFSNFEKKVRGLILMMTRHPLFGTK